MSDSTVETAIEENAVGPKAVTTPDGTVTQHPLQDQIEAHKYIRRQTASADPFACLKTRQIKFGSDV